MEKITKKGSSAPASRKAKMVEKTIKSSKNYPSKIELWKSLPKKIQYKELRTILQNFEKTNRIIFTKDNKIMWIGTNPKLEAAIKKGKEY